MGLFRSLFGKKTTARLKSSRKFFDIVGESNFQSNLTKITGGKTEDGVKQIHQATVILENDNPVDPNAVRIDIGNLCVGYLASPHALEYRSFISIKNAGCESQVIGGWKRSKNDEGSFGVKLKIKWPPEIG